MIHGLVIGKFLPPHRGHSLLIERALAGCDRLTVVVCERPDQELPGILRASWLAELHPRAEIRVVADLCRDDDSAAWAEYTRAFLGRAPDVVFTSEEYGPRYAHLLGCRHVAVDPDRAAVPISGTEVRADPLACWDFLAPCVRAHYAVRVCVMGAESTGSTTLARQLAAALDTVWVPEYGRLHSEGLMRGPATAEWTTADFVHIAAQQNRLEDALARHWRRILVCDTTSFTTCFWHERYLGEWSEEVEAVSRGRTWARTFVTGDEIPFVQDGLRDGEGIRHRMHRRIVETLARRDLPYRVLHGSPAERLRLALSDVRHFLPPQG